MTISRRDTIIIAVIVNVGILATLLMTTMQFEDESITHQAAQETDIAIQESSSQKGGDSLSLIAPQSASQVGTEIELNTQSFTVVPVEEQVSISNLPSSVEETPGSPAPKASPSNGQYVEITVKKGDFLDKIARANGTTVDEIKRINHLASDRLDVGQVLRVPAAKETSGSKASNATSAVVAKKKADSKEVSDAVYHVVKSGDNPWKIARQYDVKYEDILRLNNLNEEKAKNLKIGDRIRVK